MTDHQKHLVELYFAWFIQRLFITYANPVNVFQFLKATSTMLELDEVATQKLLLKIMGAMYNYTILKSLLAYEMACLDIPVSDIIKFTGMSRTKTYATIQKLRRSNTLKMEYILTEDEVLFAAELLQHFIKLGGHFPC